MLVARQPALVLAVLAALAGHCWGQQLATPPPDCITDIMRRLGWQRIIMKYQADYPGFSRMWWLKYFSRNAFFTNPSTFCPNCWLGMNIPANSDGGLLFGPHPPGDMTMIGFHWIHVVGDRDWRPHDGPAGYVSWLYRDDAGTWRLTTLNWAHERHIWGQKDIGRCAESRFIENEPGLVTRAIIVGDWLLRNAMRGQHLRMGFGAAPLSDRERGVIRSAGYEDGIVLRDGQLQPGPQADIIRTMASSLGFSFSVTPVYQRGNTSVWQLLVDAVASNQLDIGLALIGHTPALRDRVDFMHSQQYVTKYATVPRPRLDSAGFDPGKPFSVSVWVLIVTTLLVASALSWLTTWLVRRYRDGRTSGSWAGTVHDVSAHSLQVAGILCQRGVELTTNSYAIGALFLTLSLFSLLIYNFYTGVMLSYMAVLMPTAPFSSLSEATASGYRVRYQLGSQEEGLLRSNSTALIRDLLAHSAPIVHYGPEEQYPAVAAAAAASGSDIILTSDAFLAMDETLADPATCPLCYWPEPVAQTPVSMISTRYLHNGWMLNRYLKVLQETGVLNRWRRRLRRSYLAGSRLCSTEPQTAQYSQLGLSSVIVSFSVLIGGVVVAMALLLVELVLHRMTRGSNRQQQIFQYSITAAQHQHQQQQHQQHHHHQQQQQQQQQRTAAGDSRRTSRELAVHTPDDRWRWSEPGPSHDHWYQLHEESQRPQLLRPEPWHIAYTAEVRSDPGETASAPHDTEQGRWQSAYTEQRRYSQGTTESGEQWQTKYAEPQQYTAN